MRNQLTFTHRLPIHPDEEANSPCGQFVGFYQSHSAEWAMRANGAMYRVTPDVTSAPALSVTIASGISAEDAVLMLEQIADTIKGMYATADLYDFFAEGV